MSLLARLKGHAANVLILAGISTTSAARSETFLIGTGGIQLMSLTNALMASTNTALTRVNSFGAQFTRSLGKGKLFFGARADYITGGAATDLVVLSYKQIPIYAVGGLSLGSKRICFRLNGGVGYELINTITFVGTGSTDADYTGKGLTGFGAVQVLYLLGGKGRFGLVLDAGYVYSMNRVYLNVPFTSEDLDGNSSGLYARGGLALRF